MFLSVFHAICTQRLIVIILSAHTSCVVRVVPLAKSGGYLCFAVGLLRCFIVARELISVLLRLSKERFWKKTPHYVCTYRAEQNFGNSYLIELTRVSLNLSAQNKKWILSPMLAVMMQRASADRMNHHNDSVFSVQCTYSMWVLH